MLVDVDPGYSYLLEHFPDYDYRRPRQPERLDYRRADNTTGHQQRAFDIWWCIEECAKKGALGISLGSGGVREPWCLCTDAYDTDSHPYYGGQCRPDMAVRAEDLSVFGNGTFQLVLANHVIEHLPGSDADVVRAVREHWLRILKPGGVAALVVPDQSYGDVLKMDRDHKHAWTAQQFREVVLGPLSDVANVEEFDTFRNNFSFNMVLRKR